MPQLPFCCKRTLQHKASPSIRFPQSLTFLFSMNIFSVYKFSGRKSMGTPFNLKNSNCNSNTVLSYESMLISW